MSASVQIPLDLIDAARRREEGASDRLVAAAWPHAYRIAYSIVRERSAAEDAAQEACAIVYRRIVQLRAAQAFRVWFYRIVMRAATQLERRNLVLRAIEWRSGPGDDLDDCIVRVDVLQALAKLTRAQRTAVVLHYYAELNSREIGEVLDVPGSSVRFHLMQAKRRLEELLGERRLPAFAEVAGAS
ncbi:MAG TPA: sigma-70 family RNA polymerase sigma factor [Verrucomicrobiae bacterium]|nr:sigma-70 family RNA polymerase sigma factor [Verrucomicrobiae bacterium]